MNKFNLSNEQRRVVDKIVENAQIALDTNDSDLRSDLIVHATTGSGKTLMMTYAISRILKNNKDKKIVVIVATPSTSDLQTQIFNKMDKYTSSFASEDRFSFRLVVSPSKTQKSESRPSLVPENHEVFIIGTSSFTKSSLYNTTGAFNNFIDQLKGYKVLYFRDEAHYGNKKSDSKQYQNFESKIQNVSSFNCFLTATPNFNNGYEVVSLTAKELENDSIKLLKSNKVEFVKEDDKIDLVTDDVLLLEAIKQFEKVKKEYVRHNITINPAMLIQINNDADPKKEPQKHQEFNEELERIVDFIKNKSTPKNSLKYYIAFDNDAKVEKTNTRYQKLSFEELSKPNCDIDVIIFKVGASIGWDIPRANMLVQLRKVNSENLQTQTVGRIMRFPNPHDKGLYLHQCVDSYYIFSNVPVQENTKIVYRTKEQFAKQNQKFLVSEIINYEDLQSRYINDKSDVALMIQNKVSEDLDGYKNEFKRMFDTKCLSIEKTISSTAKRTSLVKIFNKLELKIYNDKQAINEPTVFEVIDSLKDFYKPLNWSYDWEQFRFFIYQTFNESIKAELRKRSKVCEPKYGVSLQPLQQNQYTQTLANKQDQFQMRLKDIEEYYFFETIPNKSDVFYADSYNEVLVFDSLKEFIEKHKKRLNIEFFFKNPTNSGIGRIEYIDKNIDIHIEHVDFVVRFNKKDQDGNLKSYTLYIEVKGGIKEDKQLALSDYSDNMNLSKNTDDYNEAKTQDVLEAFKVIARQYQNNFFLTLVFVDSVVGRAKDKWTTKIRVANESDVEQQFDKYLEEILISKK